MMILKKGASQTEMNTLLEKMGKKPTKKGLNTSKYVGTVKFDEDGLAYQKRIRSEWDR